MHVVRFRCFMLQPGERRTFRSFSHVFAEQFRQIPARRICSSPPRQQLSRHSAARGGCGACSTMQKPVALVKAGIALSMLAEG